jgi:hypothetical protein
MIITFYIIVSVLLITSGNIILHNNKGFVGVSYEKVYGMFKIDIQIGNSKQDISICLDMCNNFTWISYYLYKRHLSTSLQIINNDTQFTLVNETIPSYLFKDGLDMYCSNMNMFINVNDFAFYYPKVRVPEYFGVDAIGLGCYYDNTKYSLVHLLYEHNVITYKSFMFVPMTFNKGSVYFGKVTSDVVNKEFVYEINVQDERSSKWNVKFEGVEHGGRVGYQKKENVYFDCKEDFVLAPMDYFKYVNSTVFKGLINKGICNVSYNTNMNSVFYYCKCEGIKEEGDVVFWFGNVGVVVKFNELFEREYDMCVYLIKNNHKEEKWVFGNTFLSLFPIEFDYEKKKVLIYSDKEFKERNSLYRDNYIGKLCCGLFVVCVVGVLYSIYVIYKVKRVL